MRATGLGFQFFPGRPLIQGLDWEVSPGARIGLTGASGSGKSALIDLLLGHRRPEAGTVEIDGLRVDDIDSGSLRDSVALVRAPELFEGTILENLSVRTRHDPAAVRGVLGQVGLLDTVMRLPAGLQTRLATGGAPLSAGQAMQLALARAILGAPRLLIVDETLDHGHDTPAMETILASLFDRRAPWTLVVVSGLNRVLDRCDRVDVLTPDGRLETLEKAAG